MKIWKSAIGLACVLAFALFAAGCSAPEHAAGTEAPAEETKEPDLPTQSAEFTYEFAVVTDVGTIDDKSFNQGIWEGVKKYGEETGKTYKYYQPSEKTDEAYIEAINMAVADGAKVVVCPGYLFENAIQICQEANPDVKFIFIDAPETFAPADNTYAVKFAEEESGFLAGYAAVKDGYTRLGFLGGMEVPAVVRFGVGFVAGAEYAAEEMELGEVSIRYHYMGSFDASPEVQDMAASWFAEGTEVIFGCGGSLGKSVIVAAEEAGAKVIGVDVDQSGESATVITSAMKVLDKAVYDGFASYDAGSFPGGEFANLTVDEGAVGLPDDFTRFARFTQADYDAVYQKLVDDEGGIRTGIPTDTDITDGDPSGLPLEIVAVDFIS